MDAFAQRMTLLRARFNERALVDEAELEAAMMAGDFGAATRILHSLAGNAGMFGYPALSKAARDLEQAIESRGPDADIPRLLREVVDQIPGRERAASDNAGVTMEGLR